jgi:D-alanyl-D-alanine carboxypeptidase-like protein
MPARSEYMKKPNVIYTRGDSRGWGPGWPNCDIAKMANFIHRGWKLQVRKELLPLIQVLFVVSEQRGYQIKPGQTWSFNCRPIAGTRTPSEHSRGTAIDINAPSNPHSSSFVCDMPTWLPTMFWECGFYWGGWYAKPDTMHYEYFYRISDVGRHLTKARSLLSHKRMEDTDVLRKGDNNKVVLELQWALYDFFILTGGWKDGDGDELSRDGDYGLQTVSAVQHAVWRLQAPEWKLWGWGVFPPDPFGEIVTPGMWSRINSAAQLIQAREKGWL